MKNSVYWPAMKIWQQHLQQALSSVAQLYAYLDLPGDPAQNDTGFALRVPRPYADRIERGNLQDPLLLQVLYQAQELEITPGFTLDPLGEVNANPIPGLLHKYKGRVLIVLTGSCAINCRYCFRRHFSYADNAALKHWEKIRTYIQNDPTIEEVILSGGDPLLVGDEQLGRIIQDIDAITHVTTVRFHTRLPIVIPDRITDDLVNMLRDTRLNVVTVLHCNHANEIDDCVQEKLALLKPVSTLLNQAVLLKGVNDSVDALVHLSKRLFESKILPYYLHQLDPVTGTQHFFVSPEHGVELIAQIRAQLPGYLVPQYVQELSGATNKSPLSENF